MKENVVKEKSMSFAVRIVNLCKYLNYEKQEFVIAKQILRSGTSIGANIAEGNYAISKKEFLAKNYIALKECSETLYWLELLHRTEYLDDNQFRSLRADGEEIYRLLQSITKTVKTNLESKNQTEM